MDAAPSASAARKTTSQRAHAAASVSASASELKIDEFIGVLIAQFDEERNRDNAERGGQHGSRPRVEPRHDVLRRRQQKRDERRKDNRPGPGERAPIRHNREPLIDMPRGFERTRAENRRG